MINESIRNRSNNEIKVRKLNFINVQGLSQIKFTEIENIMEDQIFILSETQLKRNRIRYKPSTRVINKMRLMHDRKGGGLMFVWKENLDTEIEEIETKAIDLLMTKCKIGKLNLIILAVYMSTTDLNRNKEMKEEIIEILDRYSEEHNLIIIGDFNAHLGYIGMQPLNNNGRILIDILQNYYM